MIIIEEAVRRAPERLTASTSTKEAETVEYAPEPEPTSLVCTAPPPDPPPPLPPPVGGMVLIHHGQNTLADIERLSRGARDGKEIAHDQLAVEKPSEA